MVYQENAKEFLQRGFRMRGKINHKREKLEELRSMAERCTGSIDSVPSGRHDPHAREEIIAKMVDLQQSLSWDLYDYQEQQAKAKSLIDQIEDADVAAVAYYRYLCYKTWSEISELTDLCARQVFRLNEIAIEILEGRRENEVRDRHRGVAF